MAVTRRTLLRNLGMGAVAGATVPWVLCATSGAGIVESTRRQAFDGMVLLNHNESAYGPSPKVMAAMQSAMGMANRYAYMQSDLLVEEIANYHGVKREQIILGCGSREILHVSALAFLGNGKRLVQASPTFEAIEHYARSIDAEVVSIPLTPESAHDLDSMLTQVTASTGLVYICNPNNPTASITPRKDLESFISKLPVTCCVLIDEAYHHYVKRSALYSSFIDSPVHDERVIVCRTFSGAYALAGLPLGYGIGSSRRIELMHAQAAFDVVNVIAARAAAAALEDTENLRDSIKKTEDARQEFVNQATARMLKPIDSHTNFVMMNTRHPAEDVIRHLRQHNVLIGRRFPAMDTYVRVSLGTREEMQAFWRAWDTLPYPRPTHH